MAPARLRGAALTALFIFLLALPGAASAAVTQPVDLGDAGEHPNVTLRADGTADIIYDGLGINSKTLTYCQLPPGASACSVKTVLPTGQSDSLQLPIAFGSGATVRVVSYRYGLSDPATGFSGVMMYTSNDGGVNFDTGVEIGEVGSYDIQLGPGNRVSTVTSASSCGGCFQSFPLDGTKATGPAVLSPDYGGLGTIVMLDGTTPLVVQDRGDGFSKWFRYNGSGDLNDAANWTVGPDIAQIDYPHLVTGPAGTFLISQNTFSGPDTVVRRWNGNGFDAPAPLQANTHTQYAVQDAAGRTHLIANVYDPGKTGSAFFYASSDDGTNWARERVIYPGPVDMMRTAINADHFGVVVGRTQDSNGHIWVARIGPSANEPSTGAFVGASLVSGTVLIQVPGSKRFVELRKGDVIPVGSVVDTTKGRVQVTIALPNGTLQATDFFQGVFRVTQAKNGLATMALAGGNFRVCGARGGAVHAAKSKKVVRQLWGAGKGKFATKGRYAAAAIRGTTWDTVDRCDGTLVRVTQGKVAVTNLKSKRVKVLKKGQSLFVPA